MSVNLTEIGWSSESGDLFGTWTDRSDVVNADTAINVAQGLTVNTMNGNDIINSDSESEGIFLDDNSQLNTDQGDDLIFSTGFVAIELGFNAVLDTAQGNDTLSGDGFDGFFIRADAQINTGSGDDLISGTGFAIGVGSRGAIDTGKGNDTISGIANGNDDFYGSTGIANFSGEINTGSGDDLILGKGEQIAIANGSGMIDTGEGNDIIDGLTGGFSDPDGSGRINLGQGDDLIRGFGDHRGNIDGGRGNDRAELGFDYDETLITFGSTGSSSIDITFDSETMSYTNIEVFDFNGQTFSLESLQAMV